LLAYHGGPQEDAAYKRYVNGFPIPQYFTTGFGGADASLIAGTDVGALATRLASRTNPSRPVVDLPVAAVELKDLPKMVKQAGDAIRWLRNNIRTGTPPTAGGIASANLAYQFGWAPLLSDLRKLLDFQAMYAKKRTELENLFKKGGSKRSATLEESTDTNTVNNRLFEGTVPISITGSSVTVRKYKAWGTCKWYPLTIPQGGNSSPSESQIWRSALGLDVTLSAIWELLPWSWLFDWYSNIGDYLMMHRNTIPATVQNICIMRMFTNTVTHKADSVSHTFSWGGAQSTHVRKERFVRVVPTLGVTMPFLGASQLSILGSLLITRASSGR